MIKKYLSGYSGIILFVVVLLSIIISIRYLDTIIAIKVWHFLKSHHVLHKATENIPDLLPYLVGAGTVLTWIIYLYRSHEKKNDTETKFLHLAAIALPAVYVVKTFFQYALGRTDTRVWLIFKEPIKFNFFSALGTGSFPSGHMSVFTAFGTVLVLYYPQYSRFVIAFLLVLGAALIATDYHYLSDVIAGTYLGFVSTYGLWLWENGKEKR